MKPLRRKFLLRVNISKCYRVKRMINEKDSDRQNMEFDVEFRFLKIGFDRNEAESGFNIQDEPEKY